MTAIMYTGVSQWSYGETVSRLYDTELSQVQLLLGPLRSPSLIMDRGNAIYGAITSSANSLITGLVDKKDTIVLQ